MNLRERFLGAMFGLAYGDAISFPALFHRFQAHEIPRRRHHFLWRTNNELDEMGISRMMLPFTHRIEARHLEICPADDTEWALLTLRGLLQIEKEPTPESFVALWKSEILPVAAQVRGSFSQRAAIENLQRGLEPPITGNDNPLHYEDCAVIRAVPIGLFCTGDPDRAAQLAEWDAQITQAEDGIYAARAMASAVALLADGADLQQAFARARLEFPAGSWIRHTDTIAQECLREMTHPEELIVLLTKKVINSVYSYGNAAPETLPAAFVIVEACSGGLLRACAVANSIAKSSDSLPAMVGALCGIIEGTEVIGPLWHRELTSVRGLCLPFLQGADLEALTLHLLEKTTQR